MAARPKEKIEPPVPPVMKRSMLAPHGPKLSPQYDQEDEWQEFCERTDTSKVHDFGRYWWRYGRDEDDDGYLREAVFLEVPMRKDAEAKNIRANLTMKHLTITVHGEKLIDEDFEDCKWLNVGESYWEIEVKEVKKVRRKVLRYVLYILMDCPKYITQWLFLSEKTEDDGRFVDQNEEEEDNIDDRLRLIAKMKEPEPYRDADIWFSETEEEEERWCDGCGSTRVVVMKKHTDVRYMKYCNDCPFVSPAKETTLPTGLLKQRDIDEKRARKKRLKARKEEAKKRLEAEKAKAEGEPDRTEEVPEDHNKSEKTRVYTDQEFCDILTKALRRGEIKWEDY
uniref:CS domain-containing protein n=1 Tax=Pyrodinium bahamense TaxID=73915 RepID=A0A7S0A8P5_9DINO